VEISFSAQVNFIPCEVVDIASYVYKISSSEFGSLNCLIIQYSREADREKFLSWLKNNNRRQVLFFVGNKKLKAVLLRAYNNPERGLLIYKYDIIPNRHEIIRLILP